MSIQFSCISCGKAIEIDDEWALRLVECPYCHDTITAPGPSATCSPSPVVEEPPSPAPPAVETSGPVAVVGGPRTRAGNKLAVIALILACVSLVLLLWVNIALVKAVAAELGPEATEEDVERLFEDPSALQRILYEAAEREEPWIYGLGLGFMAWFALWIAALICSLIAVNRRGRRGTSIAALLVSLLPILRMLLGALVGV